MMNTSQMLTRPDQRKKPTSRSEFAAAILLADGFIAIGEDGR
jgi:hypothetical protein